MLVEPDEAEFVRAEENVPEAEEYVVDGLGIELENELVARAACLRCS